MNRREAFKILLKLHQECKAHNGCNGCPFYSRFMGGNVCALDYFQNDFFNECVKSISNQLEVKGQQVVDVLKQVLVEKECQDEKQDNINHPKHYLKGGMEGIDVIKAAVSNLSGFEAVCVANVIKYVWRYKEKNGLEDLQKAAKYLEWLQEEVQKNEKG